MASRFFDALWPYGAPPASEPDKDLETAIRADDVEAVRRAIAEGANVKGTDSEGYPYLYEAAFSDTPDIVDLLLQHGADPTVQKGFWLAFHRAVLVSTPPVVRAFIRGGVDPNARSLNEENALHVAVLIEGDTTPMLSFLIAEGVDVNEQDSTGETPLHRAIYMDKPRRVKLLLENGADPRIPDAQGNTPVQYSRSDTVRRVVESHLKKTNARNLAMVSATTEVPPAVDGEAPRKLPYDTVREIGKFVGLSPARFTPQSARGRKTRARKTTRRQTRRRR
jgi:ankyrin repeat protein